MRQLTRKILTTEDVRNIRALLEEKRLARERVIQLDQELRKARKTWRSLTARSIAKKFNVREEAVQRIDRDETWLNVR